MKAVTNFYKFTGDGSKVAFSENMNNYGMMTTETVDNKVQNTIEYNYFVKNSGVISLEDGIPLAASSENNFTYRVHFPGDVKSLERPTNFEATKYMESIALNAGRARVTWANINQIDSNVYPHLGRVDYNVTKGGTIVFTLAPGNKEEIKSPYFSHLNKLVINGEFYNQVGHF